MQAPGSDLSTAMQGLVTLMANDPRRTCELLYELSEALAGQRVRPSGPFGRAAARAAHHVADISLEYAREVDMVAEEHGLPQDWDR